MVKSKHFLEISSISFLPWIMEAIAACRVVLSQHQSGQWQGKEPSKATIEIDIQHRRFYLLKIDDMPVGGAAILEKDDAYDPLLSGAWLNDEPYRVIHRFFIHPLYHGKHYSPILLNQLEAVIFQQGIDNIRIDTHARNLPMRGLLAKLAYTEVGKVILPHAGERLVYHKVRGKIL